MSNILIVDVVQLDEVRDAGRGQLLLGWVGACGRSWIGRRGSHNASASSSH